MGNFLLNKKEEGLLTNNDIGDLLGVEGNNISKMIRGYKSGLKADSFFRVFKAFENVNLSFSQFCEEIYPGLLDKRGGIFETSNKKKDRTDFGQFMEQFEIRSNSIKEIAESTGIKIARLNQIYFLNGAIQAYELILIEKALGKAPGELFEMYFGSDTKSNK